MLLQRQHAMLRAGVYRQLESAREIPWVTTTEDLGAVLKNLLSEIKPASEELEKKHLHDSMNVHISCRMFVCRLSHRHQNPDDAPDTPGKAMCTEYIPTFCGKAARESG